MITVTRHCYCAWTVGPLGGLVAQCCQVVRKCSMRLLTSSARCLDTCAKSLGKNYDSDVNVSTVHRFCWAVVEFFLGFTMDGDDA